MLSEVNHLIAPVWDERSRVLLLGTMPSPRSREAGFYYAHPRNRFWPTLARVFGESVPETVQARRELALKHRVAIWDVLESCVIENASDSSIRQPVPNDLTLITGSCPIQAVFTTGRKAFELYERLHLADSTGLSAVCLPSTSPANCRMRDEELATAYSVIKNFL